MSDADLVGSLRSWSSAVIDQAHAKVGFDAADRIERLESQLAEAREALAWYAGHVSHCNMLHGAGDTAREALARDMGQRAMQALAGQGDGCIGEAGGGNWNVKSRPRVDTEHQQMKLSWEAPTGEEDEG